MEDRSEGDFRPVRQVMRHLCLLVAGIVSTPLTGCRSSADSWPSHSRDARMRHALAAIVYPEVRLCDASWSEFIHFVNTSPSLRPGYGIRVIVHRTVTNQPSTLVSTSTPPKNPRPRTGIVTDPFPVPQHIEPRLCLCTNDVTLPQLLDAVCRSTGWSWQPIEGGVLILEP